MAKGKKGGKKSKKGHIPMHVLLHRYDRLERIIKKRGGKV